MGNSVIFPSRKDKIAKYMESRLYYYKEEPHEVGDMMIDSGPGPYTSCMGDRKPITKRIPYLLFKEETEPSKSQYLMIYFHGNSAVLSKAYKTLERYHSIFKISIMSPEYPGYGIYDTESTSEWNILEDAKHIIRHCIETLGYKEENIILMGRSLGTGVAAKMGALFPKVKAIILISPYLSIREVASNKVGWLLAKMVPDIFRTRDIIDQIKAPILFIHGLKDTLIPSSSSEYLYERCTSSAKMLRLNKKMEHKKMDFYPDIIDPLLTFLAENLQMVEFQEQYKKEKKEENIMQIEDKPGVINLENSKGALPAVEGKMLLSKADPTELE